MKKHIAHILIFLILFAGNAFAATHYVSPTGTDTWANSTAAETPCSLATANSNAAAGDVVNLTTGTYTNGQISPTNSGSAGNVITFQAYPTPGTTSVIFTGSPAALYAIHLDGKSYIKIDGITITDVTRWLNVHNSSNHNEITRCTFTSTDYTTSVMAYIGGKCAEGVETYDCPSTHNWFHANTVYNSGDAPCGEGNGLMGIGSASSGDTTSNYNTIEDNTFYHGGHHTLQNNGSYNIIRGNVARNDGYKTDPTGCTYNTHAGDPSNSKYGHRNFEFAFGGYNLIERNRLGYAAVNPANNGADNITLSAANNILRYNASYGADGPGIYLKNGAQSINNRIYNNTFYKNGQYSGEQHPTSPIDKYAIKTTLDSEGSAFKNNILYQSGTADWSCNGTGCAKADQIWANNLCDATDGELGCTQGNPTFTDPDMTDMTSTTNPDLTLQAASPAIEGGTYLTLANGAGTNSTTLIVDDALYFQDGTWGSSLSTRYADWIKVGSVVVQISSIDYDTNTITLASAISWADDAEIRLYKKSDGVQVLYGSETDMGAHEYAGATTHTITASKVGDVGTLTPTGEETVSDGADSVTYTATDPNGWKHEWSGTCGATGSGVTYQKTNVTEDCTVIATFTEIKLMPW